MFSSRSFGQNHKWATNIRSGISLIGLVEFFHLWDIMQEKELSEEEDRHIWRLDKSGLFSSKSAYRAFFQGAITFFFEKREQSPLNHGKESGKHGARRNARFSYSWLFETNARLQIDLQKGTFLIRNNASYVIKRRKLSNTF
jgi:hypothetical protein